jgi:hypothetical protein
MRLLTYILLLFVIVGCSDFRGRNEPQIVSTVAFASSVKYEGKNIAIFTCREVEYDDKTTIIGPAVVLLNRDSANSEEGSLTVKSESKYSTVFNGEILELSISSCIICNPDNKTYKIYEFPTDNKDRSKFIRDKTIEYYKLMKKNS